MKLDKHLIFIGFMGSGKTTIGKLMAEKLALPFIDTDAAIEAQEGKTISQIFAEKGEAFFREKEREFISGLSTEKPSVISVGGGFPAQPNAIELLNKLGLVIYLNTSLITLIKRLKDERERRPLLSNLSDAEFHPFVEELLSVRVHFYKQAKLIMPNESNKPNELVEKLIKELHKLFD